MNRSDQFQNPHGCAMAHAMARLAVATSHLPALTASHRYRQASKPAASRAYREGA